MAAQDIELRVRGRDAPWSIVDREWGSVLRPERPNMPRKQQQQQYGSTSRDWAWTQAPPALTCTRTNRSSSGSSQAAPRARVNAATCAKERAVQATGFVRHVLCPGRSDHCCTCSHSNPCMAGCMWHLLHCTPHLELFPYSQLLCRRQWCGALLGAPTGRAATTAIVDWPQLRSIAVVLFSCYAVAHARPVMTAASVAAHRKRSSGVSTSAAAASARLSAGSREGSVVVSAMSWIDSKWCCRCASASWQRAERIGRGR